VHEGGQSRHSCLTDCQRRRCNPSAGSGALDTVHPSGHCVSREENTRRDVRADRDGRRPAVHEASRARVEAVAAMPDTFVQQLPLLKFRYFAIGGTVKVMSCFLSAWLTDAALPSHAFASATAFGSSAFASLYCFSIAGLGASHIAAS
jgi:hypothetical protein